MKRIIIALLFVCFFVQFGVTATDTRARTKTVKQVPYGVKVYDLHTRYTVESIDTFSAANDNNFYGPYELCDDGEAMPTKMYVEFDIATGTTPTLSLDYQIIQSTSFSDTLSGLWVPIDTIAEAAGGKEVTLAPTMGKAICFQINNFDGSASQIPGLVRVVLKNATVIERRK